MDRRQRVQSGWLVSSGLAVLGLMVYSSWLRLGGDAAGAATWMGWSIIVMLASVWVAITIQFAWPPTGDVRCCQCCRQRRTSTRMPPVPQPGDPVDLHKL